MSSIVFKSMATPDISILVQKLNDRKKCVLSLNSKKALSDSSLCEELSFAVRNDQEIRQELDSLQLNLISLLNSDTLTCENIEPQDANFVDTIFNYGNNLNYCISGAGLMTGSIEHHFYAQKNLFTRNTRWRGKNGVWYSTDANPKFYGNQYTGKRDARIHNKIGKVGTKLFIVGILISTAQLIKGVYEKDDRAILKSSTDIIIACIATYGGPPGWIIGGMYLMMDLAGVFDGNYGSPTYCDPTIAPRDKTYVAPKTPQIFFKR